MIQVSELRSHRLPIVPSARMDRATTAQWKHDMAATIAEERRPQRVSNIKLKSEVNAPYYIDANFDKSASKKRSTEELKKAPHGLSLSSNDESIRSKAKQLSKRCEKASRQLMTDMLDDFTEANERGKGETFALKLAGVLVEVVTKVVESGGSPAPRIMGDDVIATMAAVRRTWCEKWWRRRLNTDFKRWKEAQHIANGRVGRGRSAYVSKDALKDRAEQIKRNSDLLKAFVAMNDEAVVSLEDCAAASVSNPKIRRHEVMTRLRGLEEWADSVGMVSHFWTLTAPSRFHRFRTGEDGRLYDNPKWDKSTPKEAQAYLVKVWSCIRAEYGRKGLAMVGFRVVEPHHDGCPHWHLLVFSEPGQIDKAAAIAKKHALKDSPDEPGAEKRRFVPEPIDRSKGSAVGYVAKYISKNLDGEGMNGERSHDGGGSINENIKKVDAWRSLWGVRQFQFFAAGAVSVWRELRRLREQPEGVLAGAWNTAQGELVAGKDARADWCAFLKELDKNPISLVTNNKKNQDSKIDYRNEYGETVWQIVGLECAGQYYQTRFKDWTLIERSEAARMVVNLFHLGLVSITVRKDGKQDLKRKGGKPTNIEKRE